MEIARAKTESKTTGGVIMVLLNTYRLVLNGMFKIIGLLMITWLELVSLLTSVFLFYVGIFQNAITSHPHQFATLHFNFSFGHIIQLNWLFWNEQFRNFHIEWLIPTGFLMTSRRAISRSGTLPLIWKHENATKHGRSPFQAK